jgi:CubicO group peptidase (beta-lactamase class C family)
MTTSLDRSALARLRNTLQQQVDRGRLPGAVALVAQGGQVQALHAVGRQDAARDTPMAEDAIFRIYSMTKPLCSLLALMLAEEGRLQLTEPVGAYLPVFGQPQVALEEDDGRIVTGPARRAPTVHDLLRHTAGYGYEFLLTGELRRQYTKSDLANPAVSMATFCSTLAALPLANHPGAFWRYSRATDVLGAVIEAVCARPLGDVLHERLLAPLGMCDTGFSVPARETHRIAEPFARCPDSGADVVLLDAATPPAWHSGGGGLMSTAADYARFLTLMLNRGTVDGQRLVSRKTIEWMTADHLGDTPAVGDMLPPGHGFGLGFAVRTAAGMAPQPGSPGMYYWSGIGGTAFFVDPAEDLFAILMAQAPNQRIPLRNLFRHLVYAAID